MRSIVCGAQTWDAYARLERTRVRYRVRRTEMVLILIVDRQKYPRDLLAWAHLWRRSRCTCLDHVRVEEVQTPGSRSQSVVFRAESCNLYVWSIFLRFLVIRNVLHLSVLRRRLALAEEVWKFARSFSIADASAFAFITW